MLKDILFGLIALVLAPIIFLLSFYICASSWVAIDKELNQYHSYWATWWTNIKDLYWNRQLSNL